MPFPKPISGSSDSGKSNPNNVGMWVNTNNSKVEQIIAEAMDLTFGAPPDNEPLVVKYLDPAQRRNRG